MVHIWNTVVLTDIVDISCIIVLYGTELVGIYTIERIHYTLLNGDQKEQ